MIFKSKVRVTRIEVVKLQPDDIIILESDDDLSDTQAGELQKAWYRSVTSGDPMVLGRGMRIKAIRYDTKEHMR